MVALDVHEEEFERYAYLLPYRRKFLITFEQTFNNKSNSLIRFNDLTTYFLTVPGIFKTKINQRTRTERHSSEENSKDNILVLCFTQSFNKIYRPNCTFSSFNLHCHFEKENTPGSQDHLRCRWNTWPSYPKKIFSRTFMSTSFYSKLIISYFLHTGIFRICIFYYLSKFSLFICILCFIIFTMLLLIFSTLFLYMFL